MDPKRGIENSEALDLLAAQEAEFNPELIHEANKKALQLAQGQCGVCQRQGFPLFLVRKSIVPISFNRHIDWEKGMVSLGEREPQTAWQAYKYVYRTLREGYIYLLCNPTGNSDDRKLDIIVYEVTYSGAMRLREFRDVKGTRPKEIPVSCLQERHNLKGLFITLDDMRYDKAWIAYSPVRWTSATVEHYRQREEERLQRFSEVNLTQHKAENISPQGRSFLFDDFLQGARYLLEFECDNNRVQDYFEQDRLSHKQANLADNNGKLFIDSLRQGIFKQNSVTLRHAEHYTMALFREANSHHFFTASHFNSLKSDNGWQQLNSTANKYQSDNHYRTEIAALVLEDSLGVAEELSIQRRQQLSLVTEGLARQELNDTHQQQLKQFHHLVRSSSHDLIYAKERTVAKTTLATAMQSRDGCETIADYYKEQKQKINCCPLAYFSPELTYTRRQYQQIERYKESLRGAITQGCENEAYLFLFYCAEQNYRPNRGDENHSLDTESLINSDYISANNEINLLSGENKSLAQLNELDKIRVIDVVGKEALAEKLGIPKDQLWHHKLGKLAYLYCRRLSVLGLESTPSLKYGLGAYREIALEPTQQQQLLAQYQTDQKRKFNPLINRVKVVHFYDLQKAKQNLANRQLEDKWKERKKRLHQDSLNNYQECEKIGYQSLYHYIEQASTDYYHYLIWLFGENLGYYQPTPPAQAGDQAATVRLPDSVNQLPFWRNELEPNISDQHIMFFYTFLTIVDSASLGNLTLPLHSALWGMLLNNPQSIYFYLLGDNVTTDEQADEQAAETDVEQPNEPSSVFRYLLHTASEGSSLSELGLTKDKQHDTVSKLLKLELKKNRNIIQLLVEKLLNCSIDGANRAMVNNIKIDEIRLQDQFIRVMRLFKGAGPERIRQYRVKMTVRGLNQYVKKHEQFMPFFHNKSMTTHKGSAIKLMGSKKDGWHINYPGTKGIGSETVTLNLLVAFENQGQQRQFEQSFSKNNGLSQGALKRITSNIIEVNNVTLDENEIKHLSKVLPNHERYINLVDRSASFILGGISLYFQINSLRSLQKELDHLKDPALRTLMKWRAAVSYGALVVNSIDTIITATNLISLGLTKKSTSLFLERAGKLNNYMTCLKVLGTVGNTLNVIDSSLSLWQATKSWQDEGNSGAEIVCVTGVVSLLMSLAPFMFAVPLWGQIAFIVVGIGLLLINTCYYDDGGSWDELNQWLNRSMLGKFDFHATKYPPYYLPTPTCMLLSDQDYYLAVNGGRCLLGSDSSLFSSNYDLNLTLNLPDFNREESEFEGWVTIKSLESGAQAPVELVISDGTDHLVIVPSATADFFTPRAKEEAKKEEETYQMDEKGANKTNKDKDIWTKLMSIIIGQPLVNDSTSLETTNTTEPVENQIGLFLINWRLGQIKGHHEVSIRVNYWPNGKRDKQNQDKELTPYLLSYHYIKD